ncbi:carboxylate-amine ligase [Saccharopolyspora phatthalungensis]|uniref:Putative glutamate--cysteine ligase 2 n=1 Tax=Saccharopolyspora phatthalungensis TaxID=664693 RepID=A0A840QAX7_9PSEU|nr:carboxylate-amine ligase [Saccharopolyspora phatthalungensis]
MDPETSKPAGNGLAVSRIRHGDDDGEVHPELAPAQIEAATSVCRDLDELRQSLTHLRTELAAAAAKRGWRLAAVGMAPTGQLGPPPVADTPRYRRMYAEYGSIIEGQGVCGCHVHVGTPDLESTLRASNRLRSWLPALLLITTNSPFYRDVDTGYASWRLALWSRLPTARPPPHITSVSHYRRILDCFLASGMVLDPAMLYWYARPSTHAPTLEVRVADAAATVDEAVLLAGLTRGLVAAALVRDDLVRWPEHVDDQMLWAACWRAARSGIEGDALDVTTGRLVPAWQLLDDLVEHLRPVLEENGDVESITQLLQTLRLRGSAASRQRAVYRQRDDIKEVVDYVLAETMRHLNAQY